jgi:hypothetical protein
MDIVDYILKGFMVGSLWVIADQTIKIVEVLK